VISAGVEIPVFVAYNLFTLRADRVGYDAQGRMLEATGNVVATNADGATEHADSMTFRIENGEAIPNPGTPIKR
jgi:lipopolysaccharide assembly outer membrane protein LptD (OstA)